MSKWIKLNCNKELAECYYSSHRKKSDGHTFNVSSKTDPTDWLSAISKAALIAHFKLPESYFTPHGGMEAFINHTKNMGLPAIKAVGSGWLKPGYAFNSGSVDIHMKLPKELRVIPFIVDANDHSNVWASSWCLVSEAASLAYTSSSKAYKVAYSKLPHNLDELLS